MRYKEPNVIEKEFLQAAKSGNMGTLKIMAHQINTPGRVRDADGLSPFHYAAEGNQVEVMEYLVACGCDPMALDGRGGTCVLEAANAGSLDALKWLSQNGAPGCVREADARGDTALHVACGKGHVHLLDFLHEERCDLEAKNVDQHARPLQYAITAGHIGCVKWLIDHGADVEAADNCFKWNALHIAACNNRASCIKLIAAACPRLLESTSGKDGITADQVAYRKDNLGACKLIKSLRAKHKSEKTGVDNASADAAAMALLLELDREAEALAKKKKKKKKKKRLKLKKNLSPNSTKKWKKTKVVVGSVGSLAVAAKTKKHSKTSRKKVKAKKRGK